MRSIPGHLHLYYVESCLCRAGLLFLIEALGLQVPSVSLLDLCGLLIEIHSEELYLSVSHLRLCLLLFLASLLKRCAFSSFLRSMPLFYAAVFSDVTSLDSFNVLASRFCSLLRDLGQESHLITLLASRARKNSRHIGGFGRVASGSSRFALLEGVQQTVVFFVKFCGEPARVVLVVIESLSLPLPPALLVHCKSRGLRGLLVNVS